MTNNDRDLTGTAFPDRKGNPAKAEKFLLRRLAEIEAMSDEEFCATYPDAIYPDTTVTLDKEGTTDTVVIPWRVVSRKQKEAPSSRSYKVAESRYAAAVKSQTPEALNDGSTGTGSANRATLPKPLHILNLPNQVTLAMHIAPEVDKVLASFAGPSAHLPSSGEQILQIGSKEVTLEPVAGAAHTYVIRDITVGAIGAILRGIDEE